MPVVVSADVDGRVSVSWYVDPDDSLDPTCVTAVGGSSRRQATTTFTDPPITVIDDGGPDDFIGQKDLNAMMVDYTPPRHDVHWLLAVTGELTGVQIRCWFLRWRPLRPHLWCRVPTLSVLSLHVTGNTCSALTGCYTDTVANVSVVSNDVGGGNAKLTNVCAYPS